MSEKVKGEPMQAMRKLSLPTPKQREKKLMQAKVEVNLRNAVVAEIDKRGLEIRQVIEYGLRHWLMKVNPKEAARLGILPNEPTE